MTQTLVGPRGWTSGKVEHREQRFSDTATTPLSYDVKTRSVTAILSKGSPVPRVYGREVLQIDARSVDLGRVRSGGIPLLDSHNQASISGALGKINDVWFDRGALMGRLKFNDTKSGRDAEGMVRRGEIGAVSIGYRVTAWSAADGEGNSIDVDDARWDDDLTFTATRWELLEGSLVCCPADSLSGVRSLGSGGDTVAAIRTRMLCLQRMAERQFYTLAVFDDKDALEAEASKRRAKLRQQMHDALQKLLDEIADDDDAEDVEGD